MDPEIRFVFEGKWYSVPADAYEEDLIQLPDGRVLEVDGWMEALPPQPMGLRVISFIKATEIVEAPAS